MTGAGATTVGGIATKAGCSGNGEYPDIGEAHGCSGSADQEFPVGNGRGRLRSRLAPAASRSRPNRKPQKQMIDQVTGSQPYGDRPVSRSQATAAR